MDISQFGDPLEKIQLSNKLDETEKKSALDTFFPSLITLESGIFSVVLIGVLYLPRYKVFQAGILSSESLREWNRNSLGRIRSTSEIDKKRKHRY